MIDKPVYEFVSGAKGVGIPINPFLPTFGYYIVSGPEYPPGVEEGADQYFSLNYTSLPGKCSNVYFSLMFQLGNWGFATEKITEWIEVSPTHKEYYERTMATKKQLEGIVKEGLGSAASAVADYELVEHDVRKYRDILNYFAQKDEHSLKSMFINNVDIHTEGHSIAKIVPRWPTLIVDFMKLKDEDVDVDGMAKKYNISKAEAVILTTKNKLYKNWKAGFLETVKSRYVTLRGLASARKKTIDEYRNWLKPYISRFKATKVGGDMPGGRAGAFKSFVDIAGLSTFENVIRVAAWKAHKPTEHRVEAPRPGSMINKSRFADDEITFLIHPYDDYIRENFILNKKTGLANLYPWLANERKYCRNCKKYHPNDVSKCETCGAFSLEDRTYADELVNKDILPLWKNASHIKKLDPARSYYLYLDMSVTRSGIRLLTGEIEDITFYGKMFTISHNILLVKFLESLCRDIELEHYIDEMLGVKIEQTPIEEFIKKELPTVYGKEKESTSYDKFMIDFAAMMKKFSGTKRPSTGMFGGYMFSKPGPYEPDFIDRFTKQYLSSAGATLHVTVEGFIKNLMGVQ